jgi:hypothetical protein
MGADLISWQNGVLAGIGVGLLAAYANVKWQLEEMRPKYLPRLLAVGIERVPFQIHSSSGVSQATLFNLHLLNDPESSVSGAVATDVRPHLTFIANGKDQLELDGRWDSTPQPKPFEPRVQLSATTLGIGERRALHIVVRFPDDESVYAFNNYSYDHLGMKSPAYRLTEHEYHIKVNIRGVGVNATTYLLLKQRLNGTDPALTILSHQDKPTVMP